jgi:hypothetical protein
MKNQFQEPQLIHLLHDYQNGREVKGFLKIRIVEEGNM